MWAGDLEVLMFVQILMTFVQALMNHALEVSVVFSFGVIFGLGISLVVMTSPPKARLQRVRVR
jgi:hypothetical protein